MVNKRVLVINSTTALGQICCTKLAQLKFEPIALGSDLDAGYDLVELDPRIRFHHQPSSKKNYFDYSDIPEFLRPISHVIILPPEAAKATQAFESLSKANQHQLTETHWLAPLQFLQSLRNDKGIFSVVVVSPQYSAGGSLDSALSQAFSQFALQLTQDVFDSQRINAISFDANLTAHDDVVNACCMLLEESCALTGKALHL
uniref:hypothetical protein n=1 Tax=Thaumasiovibrio occultus TaxID=1891184 RepID=UPI000B362CAA|nr:hypothetical protein [Thaumasiovibrio occultus]